LAAYLIAEKDRNIDLRDAVSQSDDRHMVYRAMAGRRGLLLKDIKDALYYGEDLRDKEILEFYQTVWELIVDDIDKELQL